MNSYTDYVVYDSVPANSLVLNDFVILTDPDGMEHQAWIIAVDDLGDMYEVFAYSETVGDQETFYLAYDQMVDLWKWKD